MTKSRKKTGNALGLIMTPRFKACLEAGSTENLRQLLAGWNERELGLLHRDLHIAYDAAVCELDYQYQHALRGGGFLLELETVYRTDRASLLAVFTEIHEVLGFYLDKRSPKGSVQ